MKNLITFCLLLISGYCSAQTGSVPSIQEINSPVDVKVCNINDGFGLVTINPAGLPNSQWPASTFTLSLEIFVVQPPLPFPYNPALINYPWSGNFPNCYQLNPPGNPVRIEQANISAPYTLTSNQPNFVNNRFDFEINSNGSNAAIEYLNFRVYLDCSLLSLTGSNLSLIQKWYFNGIYLQAPPMPVTPIPVHKPGIVQIIPPNQIINVNAPFGQTSDWIFAFQNNGVTEAEN
jgi:hypothetical protein